MRHGGVGCAHDLLLDEEQLVGTEDRAGQRRVLGSGPVRMRAVGFVARQLEHLRTEGGEHALGWLRRWKRHVGRGVIRVEIVRHRRQGFRIIKTAQPGHHRAVGHADAQHEATAGLFGESHRHLLHHTRVPVEDVGDAGGEPQLAGMRRQHRNNGKRVLAGGLRKPQRGVTEGFDPLRQGDRIGAGHGLGMGPNTGCAEFAHNAGR